MGVEEGVVDVLANMVWGCGLGIGKVFRTAGVV